MAPEGGTNPAPVVSLDQRRRQHQAPVLRLAPEYDGLELLYANDRHPDKLFALSVLGWVLRADDTVSAVVPWLDRLMAAEALTDPLNGRWEGFRFPGSEQLFTRAPEHKVRELHAAAEFFDCRSGPALPQEIPDTIGTHALFSADGFRSISLQEVVSWRLTEDGRIHALVVDEGRVTRTPVLAGDASLVRAGDQAHFRYFFQYSIANRIKERDPEALAAIAMLGERC